MTATTQNGYETDMDPLYPRHGCGMTPVVTPNALRCPLCGSTDVLMTGIRGASVVTVYGCACRDGLAPLMLDAEKRRSLTLVMP